MLQIILRLHEGLLEATVGRALQRLVQQRLQLLLQRQQFRLVIVELVNLGHRNY